MGAGEGISHLGKEAEEAELPAPPPNWSSPKNLNREASGKQHPHSQGLARLPEALVMGPGNNPIITKDTAHR